MCCRCSAKWISTSSTRRQEKWLCGKGRSLQTSRCKPERGVRGDRCLHVYGRLYCEFVMKKLCSFVGALQVVCLPVSVTVFQPTAEQRQTEDDGVPCQSLVHMWPGLHTRRHTEWIKPVWFAVPGDGRVHFRASTASCDLWHAAAKDSQHS